MNQQTIHDNPIHVTTLDVAGITCGACVRDVTTLLDRLPGVVHVEVDVSCRRMVAEHVAVHTDAETLAAALNEAGYAATVVRTVVDSEADERRPVPRALSSCGCCATRQAQARSPWDLGTSTIG